MQGEWISTDFSQFTRLRSQARVDQQQALSDVARQFESLFVEQMLKSMRAALPGDGGLLSSAHTQQYTQMLDQQMALSLSQNGGIGLAKAIERQLSQQIGLQHDDANTADENPSVHVDDSLQRRFIPSTPLPPALSSNREPLAPALPVAATAHDASPPESPREFVQRMLPHAERAAQRLGVSPELLIAQAALESAWGQRTPRGPNGENSFNLFGIKDHGWSGQTFNNSTQEFEQGRMVRRKDGFRVYESWSHSFDDYANFLQQNPRYGKALRQQDDVSFIREVHRAGYATDPNYATKVVSILRSSELRGAVNELKLAANRPIISG